MTTRRQRSRAQHRADQSLAARPAGITGGVISRGTESGLTLPPVADDARLVLHYRGDRTGVDPLRTYGPDTAGATYRAVGATYDAETDRTTLSFRPLLT